MSGKIIPNNLTARAAAFVLGNPVNTRPESGVDNCYPGLEFDQRNLDKAFIPDLRFEFYRSDGAHLVGVDADGASPVANHLVSVSDPLFLWAIHGRFRVEEDGDTPADEVGFWGQDGLAVWRRVHDLLPGRVAIALGTSRGFHTDLDSVSIRGVRRDLQAVFTSTEPHPTITRFDNQGRLLYMVLAGDRAAYMDEDGVIDTDAYAPGDLTKSLCAPWMFDFRDCGCFYWASNKPDVVESSDGKIPYVNFMRQDREPVPDDKVLGDRTATEMTYADLVNGKWQSDLPIVLNDREGMDFVPAPAPSGEPELTMDEVIAELRYLATVEHAVTVEYLYARYSLRTDIGDTELSAKVRAVSADLYSVAVDEMRHLRWANQALHILGQPAEVGRAEVLGQAPQDDDRRKKFAGKRYLERPFELQPLTPATLQWFIDIERPSQVLGEGLDGMYVELLRTFQEKPDQYPESGQLVSLMKLIVDEGEGHFHRFTSMQKTFDGIDPAEYVRDLTAEPNADQGELLDLADLYYEAVLKAIRVNFSLGAATTGRFLRTAVRSMHNLDEVAFLLAGDNIGPRFRLPDDLPSSPVRLSQDECHAEIEAIGLRARKSLDSLMAGKVAKFAASATRQARANTELFAALHSIIDEEYV